MAFTQYDTIIARHMVFVYICILTLFQTMLMAVSFVGM